MNFKNFQAAIQRQFNAMKNRQLFRVDIEKDALWDTYLASFPEGSNPIYRERTEHDCQCCKHFIRSMGNVVAVSDDGKLMSIWDTEVTDFVYQGVADAMARLVASGSINETFLHYEETVGVEKNTQLFEGRGAIIWQHFQVQTPPQFTRKNADIASTLSGPRTTKEVLMRGLSEITVGALDTVLELIDQNSLYRGSENRFAVDRFKSLKHGFDLTTDKNTFCWLKSGEPESVARIRNTAIGTLLVDLSNDMELDDAIKSFESKVAPANYKRPTAVVTKAMIEKAKHAVEELGFTASLQRRYAVIEDVSAADTLFADRGLHKATQGVFDELTVAASSQIKNLGKVEEVTIEQFVENILPKASRVEVLLENMHTPNLVSLVAPADLTAKSMFKWGNRFSWSYNGDMADSIKERVKKAGGSVEGDLCCRLAWDYADDLDFHMVEPNSRRIYYGNRRALSSNGGTLDLDANGCDGPRPDPAENIHYSDKRKMKTGVYTLQVNNFQRRSTGTGFDVEIEFDGNIHSIHYDKVLKTNVTITVAKISYDAQRGEFKIIESPPASTETKVVWGLPTQTFHPVKLLLQSPNHWDGKGVGNKHYFFMLDKCKNDGTARGFYNEFLTAELDKHRKVFEIVGAKMRTDEAEHQLSGVGFSSTQHNSLICRVTGAFSRLVKINF